MTLGERLVAGLRAQERRAPYRLERAEFDTVLDACDWLRTWVAEDGTLTWKEAGHSRRRHLIDEWLWLRFLHAPEQIERGGRP